MLKNDLYLILLIYFLKYFLDILKMGTQNTLRTKYLQLKYLINKYYNQH